jgi:hypothetical protein
MGDAGTKKVVVGNRLNIFSPVLGAYSNVGAGASVGETVWHVLLCFMKYYLTELF